MRKSNLIDEVAQKTGFTRKRSTVAVEAVVEAIQEALTDNQKVLIAGFGSFKVRSHKARIGRNPRTNENVAIPAFKSPVFKPGKQLKDAISGNSR
jgi:DNA-binding protein HU-beta